jgi:hypothetical protein
VDEEDEIDYDNRPSQDIRTFFKDKENRKTSKQKGRIVHDLSQRTLVGDPEAKKKKPPKKKQTTRDDALKQ